jgi:hypothetical protein
MGFARRAAWTLVGAVLNYEERLQLQFEKKNQLSTTRDAVIAADVLGPAASEQGRFLNSRTARTSRQRWTKAKIDESAI